MSTTETEKTFKQTAQVRAYFREKARLRRARLRLCADCKTAQPVYKCLVTKKKLCIACLVKREKAKVAQKEAQPQT